MNPAHLDHEALADLAEGLLDDDHAASANAHLDDCAECRDRSADLADVSRILAEIADIPVPPMPVELAARIDDAIRAESMATAKVTSLEHRRGIRHLRTFSAAAAAVVAIGGAAFVGNSLLNDSSNGNKADTAGPHAADPPATEQNGALKGPDNKAVAPAPSSYRLITSGTNYRSGTLVRQVSDQLQTDLRTFDRAQANQQLLDCIGRFVNAGNKSAVLVDSALYEGRPANVIAFGVKPGTMKIVVTGANCSAQTDDLLRPSVISGG